MFGPPDSRQERECLQKIYSVGQDLAAGFAGSVEMGFAMIGSLQKALKLEDRSLAGE
jgi:ATP-dependent protease HslVU (ClpYQ) peptidase subunit